MRAPEGTTAGRGTPSADRRRRVGLLGQFGIGNLGNEASLDAMLTVLAGSADLTILTEEPDAVHAARGLPAVSLTDPGAPRGGWRGVVGKGRDLRWARHQVGEVDAVVVPGTGLLEGSAVRATAVPLTVFWYALCARLRRRPFHVLSVGVDTGGSWLTRQLFAAVVRSATIVTVRDGGSAACVQELTRRRPPVVPDLVLADDPAAAPSAGSGPPCVAIGVIDTHGTGTVEASWDRDAYLRRMGELIGRVLAAGAEVRVVGGAGLDDAMAAEVVAQAADPRAVLAPARSMQALDGVLSACDVVVASRYHNLVAGLRLGVPLVSIGYAEKQRWLLTDLGAADRAHDVADFDPETVADQVVDLLGRSTSGRGTAGAAWLGRARAALGRQADGLRADLGLEPVAHQEEARR
ncbi:polysaccharide pyruvyl transferase family protein [Isoptericola sp. S6320L]|uniref:polysaccharide pyruvyl transferase family protein n=1 Tax=Isoptericola sp. S6320L TaxID=2926411 RepID=UPI001FF59D7C|nr:polysaccharide pyruvyl transferase family protein [Isoptericola sp. S6320L]MCK0118402.1 polysaccharide pyruvyl transferase family protein [Isoptericola sp. S6320L]